MIFLMFHFKKSPSFRTKSTQKDDPFNPLILQISKTKPIKGKRLPIIMWLVNDNGSNRTVS